MNYKIPFPGWSFLEKVAGDASSRRYARVSKAGDTAIYMDCSGPPTPGHNPNDYARISKWLNENGLKAPKVLEQDNGFLIVEDFGEVSFRQGLEAGASPDKIYATATDVLKKLSTVKCDLRLPHYIESHIHKGARRLIDWYVPQVKKAQNSDGWAQSFLKLFYRIEQSMPPCPQGFIHGDFHLDNLMALFEEKGTNFCGILDFQGAMKGPTPYDLVNLLEDARADVDAEIKTDMLDRYCEGMNERENRIFRDWYDLLAMQFHCRVLGQFIKIALNGEPKYLIHMPRLEKYVREGLEKPVLMPFKAFFADLKLDFHSANDLNGALSAEYIRSDAY